MEEDIKKIFEPLKSTSTWSLSDNEKLAQRNLLLSVMREHPLMEKQSLLHQFADRVSSHQTNVFRATSFAMAFVVVVGVGTSYAAEQALPGDPLYAMKVNVTEPVQGILAISPVEKAQWSNTLVSRRLDEAATLAVQGKLDATTLSQIEAKISDTSNDFDTSVAALQTAPSDSAAAVSAQSDHEATLRGHEQVLTALSAQVPAEAPAIAPLLQSVHERVTVAQSRRKESEQKFTSSGGAAVQAAAAVQKVAARERVRSLETLSSSLNGTASTSEEVTASTAQVTQAIDTGEQKQSEGNFGEALGTFQAAIRATEAVEVNLQSDERLKGDLRERSDAASVQNPTPSRVIPADD